MKWDKGIAYEKLKTRIVGEIDKVRKRENIKAVTKLAYLIVYGIQLRNGSRISEAVEGFWKFMRREYREEMKRKIVEVVVKKKRKRETRELVYPEFIPFKLIEKLRKYNIDVKTKNAIVYCERFLGVNTHTLRYARITYLAERGVNPSLIAKITKHSKLDFILNYTQEKLAKKINLMTE